MSYCKFYKEKEQISYNSGQTWYDIPGSYRKGEIYEYDSADCDPYSTNGKWRMKYFNGNIAISKSAPCDDSSAITKSEIVDFIHPVSYSLSLEIGNCVKTIDDRAFSNCSGLTTVAIPDCVININASAFSGCTDLISMTIGSGLTTIGNSAFGGCSSLTGATLPDSVSEIGNAAFSGCSSLTSINIPSGITNINEKTFSSCSSLTGITIPNSVTSIDCAAFSGCSSITSMTIPDSVLTIDDFAFHSCSAMTQVVIPHSVTTIGCYAFNSCSGLTSVTIPCSVTSWSENCQIGGVVGGCFYGCTALTSATIENGIKYIPDNAFAWCYNLTDLNLPDTLLNIGYQSFLDVPGFESNKELEGNIYYVKNVAYRPYNDSVTGLTIRDGTISINENAFTWCTSLTSVTIPDSVTYIGREAFQWCSSLRSVVIPTGVTEIRDETFSGCTSLTSVTIPNSVTSIGVDAFYGCRWLSTVEIPDSVTTIGDGAFDVCSGLTSVVIPSGVTSIGELAFHKCSSLIGIIVKATTPPTLASSAFGNTNNCPIYVPSESLNAYKTASGWSAYESRMRCIPTTDNITYTSSEALNADLGKFVPFATAETYDVSTSAGTIEFSEPLFIINDGAFITYNTYHGRIFPAGNNTKMKSITIPDSVISIDKGAFSGCTGLTSVTIGHNIETIGEYAFSSCTSLTSITINATTPPTMGTGALYNTNNCPIYVPCESVDTYKNAGGYWSGITSRIYGIQGCAERWVENTDGYECRGTIKISQDKKQVSTDSGSTWSDTNPLVTRAGSTVLAYNSTDCGFVPPQYRWVEKSDGYYCSCTTKIAQEKQQVSYDNGSTWSDTNPLKTREGSRVIEYNSADCGYVPPIKYILTLNDSSVVSAECDSTSAVTSGEVSTQYSGGSVVSAEIGDCVRIIGDSAFRDCHSLTGITIPNSVDTIGECAFMACWNLRSINIPDFLPYIAYSTFQNCSSLTSITIPGGITSIGTLAFAGCTGLTSIYIPSGVTSIGYGAFSRCRNLTSITVNAITPPSVSNYSFEDTNDCPIYVPSASVEAYKAASGWSTYASRIQAIP